MRDYILNDETENRILNICEELALPNGVVASSFYGPHVCGYADKGSDIDVLLITNSPELILKFHSETYDDETVSILMVDQKTFERDVDGDWLGGLLVENILVPYEPLVNREYLWDQEVKAKRRIILEILGNLVSEFPEMSHEILIKPEYFMFETMMRKASLFPPITYHFLNIVRSDLREKNLKLMMKGFRAALGAVANDGYIIHFDEHVKISEDYINAIQRRRLQKIVSIFKTVRSGMFHHTLKVFPKIMRSFVEDYKLYNKRFASKKNLVGVPLFKLEDPKKYIFIPTPLGHVSLSDKVTIKEFVRRNVPNGYALKVNLKKLGGALNTVYTLRFRSKTEEKKIVVKVFKDWYGWKWFPLALWALGTRGFTVLGKSRLEKEYAINKFLSSQGTHVPEIIYVSPKERLIFQEFVDGTKLTKIIKKIGTFKERRIDLAKVIRHVGREIAKVHNLGVALGDCKPENIIITPDGKIYFVDLEQAEREGDQTWDVAELLYYSGHYVSLSSMETVQMITREFIEGYLEAEGKIENIKKVRSPRYVKVFSFFTPPHIIFTISSTCGEILKSRIIEE